MLVKKSATLTRLLEFIFLEVFMAYGTFANNYNYANPYGYVGNNYYGGTYQPNWVQQPQQQMLQQQTQQPAQNAYNIPIEGVVFLTSDEAKAYIVPPNKRVMIMDRDKSVFYIKSADALGQSNTSTYKFEPLEETPKMEIESKAVSTEEFVTKDDMKLFATANDLQALKDDFAKSLEDLKKSVIKKALANENSN